VPHPADHPGPFALVEDLEVPVLRDDDAHHLGRVLRLRAGDALVLGDGAGRWRPARFGDAVEPTGPVEHAPADAPALAVGFALVKGDKPELIVQKLTELGVDRIIPFRAHRSVVQWDEAKAAKAQERLAAVARSAAMQCHRPWLPVVDEVTDLRSALTMGGVALADRSGSPLGLEHHTVLVGPEGGWDPAELALAARAGAPCVAVGDHVLRAETAVVTVGALLTALRAGLAAPANGLGGDRVTQGGCP
jgi:16S rRNA (uracil1498-N3)-methyltransferase